MLRVAMLSRWHVHADEYAKEFANHPDAHIQAVWDEDPLRGKAWADELSAGWFEDLDQLLSSDSIDAVSVVTPTNLHRDVMVKAAKTGKHIFTEKVLATTISEANEIAEAVHDSGVTFCISYPRRNLPEILYAKQAADKGLFGDITTMRVRISHDGATRGWLPEHFYDPVACGGGAMMDLGAHGMYLTRWFLGEPARVSSIFNHVTQRAVEDNTVTLIEYENGAIAINETSFVSYGGHFTVEIDGTEGSYRMLSPGEAVIRSKHLQQTGWQPVADVPAPGISPIGQFVRAALGGEPAEFGMPEAMQLTELMEAAYLSHREARAVELK
ncbi:MAG: Gfo/Idh/MocA family oxidoreductase [Pseudomonadales bacterium]